MIGLKKTSKFKKLLNSKYLFALIFTVPILFLGIGYAQITSSLGLSGSATANPPESVLITNITYTSDVGADLNNSFPRL